MISSAQQSIGQREYIAELERRDALLKSVNAAAQCLVSIDDLDRSIPKALRILGEGTQQDRVYVFENVFLDGSDEVYWNLPYEWAARGIPFGPESIGQDLPIAAASFPPKVSAALIKGQAIQLLTEELDGQAKAINNKSQTLSIVGVPISVAGRWWGVLGFDDCTSERLWSEAEIAVLETAATCIGTAIERDRAQKEKEAAAKARIAELAERDRILEATAAAANIMLTDSNFNNAVNMALQMVGEGLEVDRIAIGKHLDAASDEDFGHIQFSHEWTSAHTPKQTEHADLSKISDEGIEFIVEMLRRGEIFGGVVEDLSEPFRSGQLELGVKSTYSVPIFVNSRFWGVIALDDCHRLTRRSEAELEALKTLANCISSAIERDLAQEARKLAEREALIKQERAARADELEAANKVLLTRDRWLQTTAVAASELLNATDTSASVQKVLALIGENLECDRVIVMQYIADTALHELGLMRMLYEWDAENISVQLENPELQDVPPDGIEDWFKQLLSGQWVGGLVNELDEPFRSGQQALGVKSTYAVPVFVEGTLWGLVGMDHCREARRLSVAELAVFQTAASCVGSAIYQAKARQDKAAQERAKLLSSVAEAANLLLRSADFAEVLPDVVRLLGEAVGSDRCGIVTTHDAELLPSSSVYLVAEWHKKGVLSTYDATPELDGMTWQQFGKLYECLLKEEPANYLVSELSEQGRKIFEAQGASSIVFIPIVVNDKPWGQIGFDNCGEPRLYDEAEISILQVAAESIAAAIARQTQENSVREAEERYRNLIALSTEGVYRLELNEPISRDLPVEEQVQLFYKRCYGAEANDAFAQMYGYQNADEMVGWRLTDIHVEASEQNLEFLSAWLGSHDCRISNSESEELDVAGDVHYFLNNVIGIVKDNYLVRVWGTQTDITELKKAQAAREKAEKAILAEREKAACDRAKELAKTNEAISRTLSVLATNPEPDSFLCLLVQELSEIVGAHNTGLFLYDEKENTLSRYIAVQDGKAYRGHIPRDTEMLQYPFPADVTDVWRVILESAQPLTFLEVDAPESNSQALWWEDTVDWHIEEGHQEAAFARMKVGDIPIGFIGFCFREHKVFSAEQLELIQALANQATLSIYLTRLAEEAKQNAILQEQEKAANNRAAELAKTNEALSKTLNVLTTESELNSFLSKILLQINEKISVKDTHLFLYDKTTHTLRQRIAVQDNKVFIGNAPGDPDIFKHPIPADITQAWQIAINSSKPFTIDDNNPEAAEFLWPGTAEWHRARGHRAAICVCMRVGNKPIGFVGFAFRNQSKLSNEQLEFIQALTNQATLSLHLTHLAEKGKTAALSIALTEERNRLAREIHDTLAQAFTGISLQLEAARSALAKAALALSDTQAPPATLDKAKTYTLRARDLARQGLSEARRSVRALRSQALETDALPTALRKILDQTSRDTGLDTHFYLEGTPERLPDDIQLNLLRIAQEAITNTLRHAKATQIDLALAFSHRDVQLRIVDDGIGFAPTSQSDSGFGLIGIRERAARFHGTFELLSTPGIGTTLEITMPLPLSPIIQSEPKQPIST